MTILEILATEYDHIDVTGFSDLQIEQTVQEVETIILEHLAETHPETTFTVLAGKVIASSSTAEGEDPINREEQEELDELFEEHLTRKLSVLATV